MFVKKAIAIGPMCLRWTVLRSSISNAFGVFTALKLFSVLRGIKLSGPSRLGLRAFLVVAH